MTTKANTSPIILGFSGGLDTSFCVPWMKEHYGRPVVTVTINTGGIDAEAAKVLAERSQTLGAVAHHLVDARPAYFEQVLKYLVMGNVRRGNLYPLCVGAERVLQAQTVAQWARQLGTDVVAHGSTAAGNDQVRRFQHRLHEPLADLVRPAKDVALEIERMPGVAHHGQHRIKQIVPSGHGQFQLGHGFAVVGYIIEGENGHICDILNERIDQFETIE